KPPQPIEGRQVRHTGPALFHDGGSIGQSSIISQRVHHRRPRPPRGLYNLPLSRKGGGMGHKEALKKKILERRDQLREEFKRAEREGPPERKNGLEAALRFVDDALQGGWENVSGVAAVELTRWLDSTLPLVTRR